MKRYTTPLFRCSLAIATAMTIAACADIDLSSEMDDKPIQFSAREAFSLTRAATTNLQSTLFDEGEDINVFIEGSADGGLSWTEPIYDRNGETTGNPSVFKTTDDKGTMAIKDADKQPYYPVGSPSSVMARISAAYPSTVLSTTPTTSTFTVQDDQSTERGYKNSDLMFVKPFVHQKNNQVIPLPFEHKMAKIIINAVGEPGITMDGILTVGSMTDEGNGSGVFRSVDIDMTTCDFSNTVPVLDDKGPVTIINGGAVLIPPQTVKTSDFVVATGHKDNTPGTTEKARFGIIGKTFEAGKTYKLTLAISADNLGNHVTISDWTKDYGELTLTPSGGYLGITISEMDDELYDGTPKTPKPEVYYGTDEASRKKLEEGEDKDFIYQYVDNVNGGNGQVLVIGQNFYAGLAAVQGFKINRAPAKIYFDKGTKQTGDDGTGITFELNQAIDAIKVNNTGDGAVTYTAEKEDGSETDVVSVDPVEGSLVIQNVGTCYIRATASDGTNYYYTQDANGDGNDDEAKNNTDRYKVVIKPKPATAATLGVEFDTGNTTVITDAGSTPAKQYFVYNGEDHELTNLIVKDGEHTLAATIDYDYSLTNSKNAGKATLTITGKKNYANSEGFVIEIPVYQATPTITVDENDLTMAIHQNTAPVNRRKTRTATTESWAADNLTYTVGDEDGKSTDVISVSQHGVITGLKAGTAYVYVNVTADNTSGHNNWAAATQRKFKVTVVSSDFDFNLYRDDKGKVNYTASSTTTTNNRVVTKACHAIWTCPASGTWQLDCWGAQGASTPTSWTGVTASTSSWSYSNKVTPQNRGLGGRGAHIAGRIFLEKGQKLHIFVGEQGRNVLPGEIRTSSQVPEGQYEQCGYAWNGGANVLWGGRRAGTYNVSGFPNVNNRLVVYPISGGGGATDISLMSGDYAGGEKMILGDRSARTVAVDSLAWKSPKHLYSRIIVAGGGGGGLYYDSPSDGKGFADGGDGGGYIGGDGLFNDNGKGGQLDRGGYGGSLRNWQIGSNKDSQMTHEYAKVYDDGPYAGGWSGSDGMFGEGGYYTCTQEGNGCGGGGWYGGGAAGQAGANGSGGGGSSYLYTKDLAKYYTTDSSLKTNSIVKSWGDENFFEARATKYKDYVPSAQKTPSGKTFPYFSSEEEYITKDAGTWAGDGKAMITAVEIDD